MIISISFYHTPINIYLVLLFSGFIYLYERTSLCCTRKKRLTNRAHIAKHQHTKKNARRRFTDPGENVLRTCTNIEKIQFGIFFLFSLLCSTVTLSFNFFSSSYFFVCCCFFLLIQSGRKKIKG